LIWQAKTFENIADASATTFQTLFAQTTFNIDEQSAATAPLNLLSLPYYTCVTVVHSVGLLCRCGGSALRTNRVQDAAELSGKSQSIQPSRKSPWLKMHTGEQASKAMFQLRKIQDYMVENLDDVVQEGRWRAVMSKEMSSRHRTLMAKIADLEQQVKLTKQYIEGPKGSTRRMLPPNVLMGSEGSYPDKSPRSAPTSQENLLIPPKPLSSPKTSVVSFTDAAIKEELEKLRSDQEEMKKMLHSIAQCVQRNHTAPFNARPALSPPGLQGGGLHTLPPIGNMPPRLGAQPGCQPHIAAPRQGEDMSAIITRDAPRFASRRRPQPFGAGARHGPPAASARPISSKENNSHTKFK